MDASIHYVYYDGPASGFRPNMNAHILWETDEQGSMVWAKGFVEFLRGSTLSAGLVLLGNLRAGDNPADGDNSMQFN